MKWILGIILLLAAALPPAGRAAIGTFSSAYLGIGNSDGLVGLTNNKTYLNAVNLNGGALTINGVSFAASSGANPAGANW